MPTRIEVTEPEHFAFRFIGNHQGKGIPWPLPLTVKNLARKGLVKIGEAKWGNKTACYLTPLGKTCFKI